MEKQKEIVRQQYLHYGWIICILVFTGFCVIGVIAQKRFLKKSEYNFK